MVTTRQTGKGSDVVGTSVKHSRTTKAYPGWLRGSSLVASLAISLISGIIPASADTAPVTTPVAVASPEATAVASATPVATAVASATAVPATTAPVSSVRTNAIVRTRTIAGGGSQAPCVQASPVEWSQGNNWSSGGASSTDCPASLGLKVTNQSVAGATGTTPYRVGDVIKVDVVARANVATGTYGYATYLDFDTTDYQLVAADGRTPITSGATSGVVSVPDTIDGKPVTTRTNAYRTNATGMAGGAIGEIDLDVGVALTDSQSPPAVDPIMIGPGTDTVLGTFRLRVKRNPMMMVQTQPDSSQFRIGLRHSSAGNDRNSVVSGAGDNAGLNILGQWTSANPVVAQSSVSLVLATRSFSVARIGDVLPVDIKLHANTDARHIDTVQGTVSLATSSFIVVTGPSTTTPVMAGGAPISPASSDLLAKSGPATGTFAINSGTANVRVDVTGATPFNLSAGDEKVIGTIYVRPVQRTVGPITLGLAPVSDASPPDQVGERVPGGSVGFASTVTSATVSQSATPSQCSGSCSTLNIGAVRGTIGVSLEVRSPRADDPLLTSNAGWRAATSTMTPFTAVDGRFLDVKVIVNAGDTDNRSADRFTIVLQKDYNQFQAEEAVFLPAPGITLDGLQDLYGSTGDPYNILRLASSAPLTTSTELGRLRYTLNPSRQGNSYGPYNSTIQVVEQQYDPAGNIPTSLTNHAGP
ncbi:MAG: hypothetical protein EB058_14920, partial [Proteobacteria bacterium]|nr:hypothetical protein [Pseudomonadota bacterium]